jgi:hypothetical protein
MPSHAHLALLNRRNFMRAISALLAAALLGIYAYFIFFGIQIVTCVGVCTGREPGDFNGTIASYVNLIGGLVCAIVVAELAITPPTKLPYVYRLEAAGVTPDKLKPAVALVWAYLLVWLIAGLAAFLVTAHNPEKLVPLTDVARSWIGFAVAAAYAYFGINPPAK